MTSKGITYRSYAMEYGTFVGLSWGALFLSYVGGICHDNALLILICFALCGVAFMLPLLLAHRLNKKAFMVGERLTYFQGLFFSFSMFMYACLLNGLIVYAYFQFFDEGLLFERLNSMVTQPEIVAAYQQMGMGEQYQQMLSLLNEAGAFSSWEKTVVVFNNNFFFSIFFSLVVAIVASYNLEKLFTSQNQKQQQ